MKNHLFKVNQRQRYAIRKFSVGIGSTLIGVTLFLGMQNHAHAAENSESKTQQNTEENNASSTRLVFLKGKKKKQKIYFFK
ncbi:YSIRK-type signal peptide-containing protein [Staphylococcus aureus]|uniref:YSIRK-type signal peptide-containing protein n=1 Tax=Staphylococcus aureus TaxID=1280 RepID=UPI0022E49D4A|nr:YSIRK-type signal peptide-containing protein [Staphylococcus aureus]MDA2904737.1 YSIRK-type signal peptide-containing protein [Staphylococcus aureus]